MVMSVISRHQKMPKKAKNRHGPSLTITITILVQTKLQVTAPPGPKWSKGDTSEKSDFSSLSSGQLSGVEEDS